MSAPPTWAEVPVAAGPRAAAPRAQRHLGPYVGPVVMGVVAVLGWRAHRHAEAAASAGLAVLALHALVLSAALRDLVARATRRLGEGVGHILAAVVMGAAFVLVVTPLGLGMRALGLRPLEPGAERGAASTWLRAERPPRPAWSRPFSDERSWRPPSGGRGGRRAIVARTVVAVLVVQAVVGGAVVWYDRRTTPRPELAGASSTSPRESAALQDAPGGDQLFAELAEVSAGLVYSPFTGSSLRDLEGEYVNVAQRVRRSYEAAAVPGVEPLDVWFFGGSTMFGFDAQRDLHTIPSEVVRRAEVAGIAIRARNYGSPGFVGYQEAVLLSLLVTAGERPDLVVFYDGTNDVALQVLDAVGGLNPLGEPADLGAFQTRGALVDSGVIPGGSVAPPGPLVDRPRNRPPTADDIVDAVVDVYAQGMELAAALGERAGFPVVHLWQPDIYSRAPLDPGEQEVLDGMGLDRGRFATMAALNARVRDRLPAGVIDISDALDEVDGPVLADTVHVNEEGAAAVADALFAALRPRLEELSAPG